MKRTIAAPGMRRDDDAEDDPRDRDSLPGLH
jgi:hypothetical protein